MPFKDLKFDGTITLGHLLQIIVLLGSLFFFMSKTETRIALNENKLSALEETYRGIPDLKTDVAVIKTTLKNIEQKVDEIKGNRK